jgi:hypothetical protein
MIPVVQLTRFRGGHVKVASAASPTMRLLLCTEREKSPRQCKPFFDQNPKKPLKGLSFERLTDNTLLQLI